MEGASLLQGGRDEPSLSPAASGEGFHAAGPVSNSKGRDLRRAQGRALPLELPSWLRRGGGFNPGLRSAGPVCSASVLRKGLRPRRVLAAQTVGAATFWRKPLITAFRISVPAASGSGAGRSPRAA
ncbi:hypothetical protein GCM10007886_19590 [Methylobacterium gregans]|nr:hypothetical protein GCM10007886_19590 [Methylobacterium gregans]